MLQSSRVLDLGIPAFQGQYSIMPLCYFSSWGLVNEALDHNETVKVTCSEVQEVFFYCGFALIQFQSFTGRLVKLAHSRCESKAWSELINCAWEGDLFPLCWVKLLTRTFVQGIYEALTSHHFLPCSCKSNTDVGLHLLLSTLSICLTPLCTLDLVQKEKFNSNTEAANCPHTSEV